MSTFELRPTGPVSVSVELAAGVPEPARRHFGVARGLVGGLRPLVLAGPDAAPALAFLAAQVCETALKAFLLKHVTPKRLKERGIRHDLGVLWAMAVGHGLPVDARPPQAIELLVRLHQSPYPLRYAGPQAVQLLCLPQSASLADEVDALLRAVDRAL